MKSKRKLGVIGGALLLIIIIIVISVNLFSGRENETVANGIILPEIATWQKYPDLDQEKKAIDKTMEEFRQAMLAGDIEKSLLHVVEEKHEEYNMLFNSNPEAMPVLASILEKAKISFLGANQDSDTTTTMRIAEYSLELDGTTVYIVFIKLNDTWLLYSF